MARPKAPRLGRPPLSTAGDTRQRIVSGAAELFADQGYGVTTNKEVAQKAGISTGALYYYFESKLDMYVAVFRAMQSQIDKRIADVMESETTFSDRFRGILEVAYELHDFDPMIARFQGAARIDRVRYPEIRAAIPNPPGEGFSLLKPLIDGGIATGEIAPERADLVAAVVRTVFVGMVDVQSTDQHRQAIDGINALLDGDLVNPPRRPPARRRAAPTQAAGGRQVG